MLRGGHFLFHLFKHFCCRMYCSATIHFVTNREIDRQTTVLYDASRSHCVQQYDRLKILTLLTESCNVALNGLALLPEERPLANVDAKNPLHTFPRNFPVDREVANLLPTTSRCNGIWETKRHNRHNRLLPAPTCYRLVADLSFTLRTCYRLATGKLV